MASKMVKVYDPFRNAFCKVPIEAAKKLLSEMDNIKKAIDKAESKAPKPDKVVGISDSGVGEEIIS